jgi:hypothetical protein
MNNVEAAAPQTAQTRSVAILMEARCVSELESVESSHAYGHLVESAEDWTGGQEVVGNYRETDWGSASGNRISQRSDENAILPFPIEALSRGHSSYDSGNQNSQQHGLQATSSRA